MFDWLIFYLQNTSIYLLANTAFDMAFNLKVESTWQLYA